MFGTRMRIVGVMRKHTPFFASVATSSSAVMVRALALALTSLLAGAGCASPQLYTTAYSHRGPSEFAMAIDPVYNAIVPGKPENAVWFGDFQLRWRFEAGDHCDIGLLLGLPRIGGDLKCAFVQTKHHAFALSAGASATIWDLWLNAPLLYTVRNNGWAFTVQGGIAGLASQSGGFASLGGPKGELGPPVVSADIPGTYLRGGISFAFGEGPRWQPEINLYHQLRGDRVTFITFGVGFHFGGPIVATDPFAPKEPPPAVGPGEVGPVPSSISSQLP
jgi:hypothetical protein